MTIQLPLHLCTFRKNCETDVKTGTAFRYIPILYVSNGVKFGAPPNCPDWLWAHPTSYPVRTRETALSLKKERPRRKAAKQCHLVLRLITHGGTHPLLRLHS
jgi:hypothetical protein